MMEALGVMREQFMHYNIKKILSTSALALVLSFGYANLCSAQGIVSLSDSAKTNNSADEIPDEISLFGDDSAEVKVITPAKSTSGVKSAAALLNNKNDAAKNAKGNVKSAKDLLAASQPQNAGGKVQSAAALLGGQNNAANNKAGVKNAAPNAVKGNAAALLQQASAAQATKTASPQAKETPTAQKQVQKTGNIDIKVVKDVEDSVFDQMSDLEKQTAILNLELKKEKVRSDIESLKAVQAKAREEEKARQEAEKRKIQEWENEEKRKILQEQQKLKELEIAYEKARQEKLLNSYKTKMLEESQKFITSRGETYKEIADLRADRQSIISDFKARFLQLTELADKATSEVIRVRDDYAKTISDLQTQISILKARLEASEQQNPFAGDGQGGAQAETQEVKLSDLYAVMEIRGQGNVLTAKLINESGIPFLVKVGTALQSGHVIDEITPTYVRAEKEGVKDYLYFSAGGILDKEPAQNEDLKIKVSEDDKGPKKEPPAVMMQGIPGVAAEMTVR